MSADGPIRDIDVGQDPTLAQKNKHRIEEAERWRDQAVARWLDQHGKEKAIANKVKEFLDARWRELVTMCLGFSRDPYSTKEERYTLNNSNYSNLGKLIREKTEQATKEWLESSKFEFPSLSEAQVKTLQDAYLQELNYRLRQTVQAKAQQDAVAILAHLTADLKNKNEYF